MGGEAEMISGRDVWSVKMATGFQVFRQRRFWDRGDRVLELGVAGRDWIDVAFHQTRK